MRILMEIFVSANFDGRDGRWVDGTTLIYRE